MVARMVMLLLSMLLQDMGWLLLVMANPPAGGIPEHCMQGSVPATKLLRRLQELWGYYIHSSET